MTAAEKIALLKHLFREVSNLGVLSWGPIKTGYRWKCDTHATAMRLAEFLLANVELLELDVETFPHRYEPENGPTLIIEPKTDAVAE